MVMPKSVTKPTSEPMVRAAFARLEEGGQPHRQHAADERERHIGQEQQQVAPAVEHNGQQQQDAHDGDGGVEQQFPLGPLLRLGRAAEHRVGSAGEADLGGDLLLRILHKGGYIASARGAGHGLAAARAFVQDGGASAGGINLRQFAQRQAHALRAAQQERADGLRILAAGLVQNHGDVGDLVATMGLRHHRSLVGGLNRLKHLDRAKAELCQPVRPQADGDARRAGRGLDLHVGSPGHGLQHLGHLVALWRRSGRGRRRKY